MRTHRDRLAVRPRARRRSAAACAGAVLVSGLPLLVPSGASADTGALTSSAPAVHAPRLLSRLAQARRPGAPVALEVAVPAAGRYSAVLVFSRRATRASSVVVEGVRLRVARTTTSLNHVVSVSDGSLSVHQPAAPGSARLTGVRVLPVAPTSHVRRDLRRQPFAPTSVWNLGIGTSATFESDTSPRTVALRTRGTAWVNESTYSHPVVQASTNDPLATVTDTRDARRSASYRIPAAAAVAAGSDRHLHVISPDGTTVDEAWLAERLSPTSYRVGRHERVDLRGSGIGPSNGTRAYGGSALGGLIRAWEVDPSHPAFTGRIDHALAIALRDDQLLYTGGPSGYADGYGTARGYVWPATEQDWDSPTTYSGTIPMGAYVAIPGSVDLTKLGLSPQGLMLARAYQDHGAYVVDRSGDPILAYVEPSPAGSAFTRALLGPDWTAADLKRIRAQLRIVTNNGPSTPNAAPLGGSRRGVPVA